MYHVDKDQTLLKPLAQDTYGSLNKINSLENTASVKGHLNYRRWECPNHILACQHKHRQTDPSNYLTEKQSQICIQKGRIRQYN